MDIQSFPCVRNTFNLNSGLCANLALIDGLKSLQMETSRLTLHSKPVKYACGFSRSS